ncbi:Succinyl-CoA--D-citramalate CoA-transferase [Geodia barretti]|uniref:Succinyl-CoA--D-citramalate CoA-transferase n=1 Tax=Geodia barretti TaxID=519541 RepID=A0AA35RXI8_GEOBA|nr:Succinyl-CoA--D-citramalate CoA-transferase [Geodia barretti]
MPGILSELRVLELTHRPSGAYCAKLLADQGADTIKVEPPGWGDQARHEPPFIDEVPHPDRGTSYLAFNTNKRGITLDVEQAEGRELFERLATTADIILESCPPGRLAELGLGYEQLSQSNPGLILVSITYFGQDGPYASYQGDDLVAQAMGGYLYAVTGSASQPPMGTALQQMEITAARNGAVAIMAALLRREQSGKGTHIDVSTMEAAVSTPSGLIHPYTYTGRNPHRGGSDGNVMDGMHLPTLDGEVTLTTAGTGGRPMQAWAEFLEEPGLLDSKWTNLDLMQETMARGLVIGLVQTPQQVMESPHLEERGFFVEMDHARAGLLKYPGSGFFIDGENAMASARPAPRLGEHNVEILCGELGLTVRDLGLLRAARVI